MTLKTPKAFLDYLTVSELQLVYHIQYSEAAIYELDAAAKDRALGVDPSYHLGCARRNGEQSRKWLGQYEQSSQRHREQYKYHAPGA